MRIIAGEFRGRILLPPRGDVTRPITDRVKQSLFDILTPRLDDAIVWDLFSGTGSMGLESLSRGAAQASFFEADRPALERLRQNITALRLAGSRTAIYPGDIFKRFRSAAPLAAADVILPNADLIFLDPPYRFLKDRPADLQHLGQVLAGNLKRDGLIIFRHDTNDALGLPGTQRYDHRNYGGMTLEFLTSGPAA